MAGPAYVIAQARARFAFGFPGEIGYRVLDEDGAAAGPRGLAVRPDGARRGRAPSGGRRPWSSVGAAGNPPRRSRSPVEQITTPPTAAAGRRDRERASDVIDAALTRRAVAAQLGRPPRGVARRRPPVPVRQPRRGDDRAAAARRHAVPDHVLPDLPPGGVADRDAGGRRADGGDDRAAAAATPSSPRRTGAAHERYLEARARRSARAGDRRRLRRRHAGPGQVPARAGRRRRWRRAGREPAR